MKNIIAAALIGLALAFTTSAQIKSFYTSTSDKICKEKKAEPNEGGDYIGICPGVAGYKLQLIEGDLRQTLFVITPQKKELPLEFNRFYMTFSAIGQKVEWRVKNGKPIALIARYNVADAENSEKRTSYLMVSKVSNAAACVTDVVPPGKDQNTLARELADTAASKPCKKSDQ